MNQDSQKPTQIEITSTPTGLKKGYSNLFGAIAIVYNLVGVIIAFVAILSKSHYVSAILGVGYPLLAIIVMSLSKGNIKFLTERKKSKKWFTMLGVFLPAVALFFNSMGDYDLLQYNNLWMPYLIITLVVVGLLILTGLNYTIGGLTGQIIFMVIVCLIFSFGCVVQVNCTFDKSQPSVVAGNVVGKYSESGRNAEHYYCTINFKFEKQQTKTTEVSKVSYDQYKPGSQIQVAIKKGTLNIPWYYITK